MNNRLYYLIFIFLIIFVASGLAVDKQAEKIINDVVKKYDDKKNIKISFSQRYYWKLTDNVSMQNGTIWLEGKEKFKIQTNGQEIVSNGEVVWTYSKTNNQVLIDNVAHSEDIKLPREILLDFKEDYQPVYLIEEMLAEVNCHLIRLLPKKKENFIKEIRVWIDKKRLVVKQIEQTDLNNNVNTYTLSDIEFDVDLKSNFFTYQAPDSVEVIDMR